MKRKGTNIFTANDRQDIKDIHYRGNVYDRIDSFWICRRNPESVWPKFDIRITDPRLIEELDSLVLFRDL